MKKMYFFALPALALALSAPQLTYAQDDSHQQDAYRQEGNGWDAPPKEFREIQRKGFHDGVEAARKDFDNHRRPDVMNRDEYRHPHVAASARKDYRDGFRRGYDAGVAHLNQEQQSGSH